MQFKDILKISLSGLSTHKSRSILTILGIVIGITSITLVMSFGNSAETLILGEIQGLGANNVFVVPGKNATSDGGLSTLMTDSLKQKDLDDMNKKQNLPYAQRIVPFVFGMSAISYESELYSATVLGSTPDAISIYDLNVQSGNFFEQEDITQKSEVVILGSDVKDELFGLSDAIGEKVKIKNKTYRVIGVLEKKGMSSFLDFNKSVLMPYPTVQQYVLGIKHIMRISIDVDSKEHIDATVDDVKTLLRNNHNISDPEKDDFFVQTQADLAKTISNVTNILTILLTSVAAISLVVGGVGIMNIMLVSVMERTREIGLRKALGATNRNISSQFLAESVVLTLSGGIMGIIMGSILSYLALFAVGKFTDIVFPYTFPVGGAMIGVFVSIVIGLIFGIFPAKQASKKSPIEALRYE